MLTSEERFQYAVNVVLKHEGGYSNDKNDSGGVTNFGITQIYANDLDLNIQVKNLTRDQAVEIYRKYMWDKNNYDKLNSIYVATKVFDASVNMGATRGAKLLQQACNSLAGDLLKLDGIIGTKTISLANSLDPNALLSKIALIMKNFYINLADRYPKNRVFLKGWLTRAGWMPD